MLARKMIVAMAVASIALAGWAGQAGAQMPNAPQPGPAPMIPPPGVAQPQMTPEEMAKRNMERQAQALKGQLGLSDEEAAALTPKVIQVYKLRIEIQNATRAMNLRNRPGRPEGEANPPPISELDKALMELHDVAQNPASTPEQIDAKLAAARAARAAKADELKTAQDDVRKMVNKRQEAKLLLMGVIE